MPCTDRTPRCGEPTSDTPLALIVISIISLISAILGGVGSGIAAAIGVTTTVAAFTVGSFLTGLIAGLAITATTFAFYNLRHCGNNPKGLDVCLAGVIDNITPDFNSVWDELFPWQAMHDRVDVVVKLKHWDLMESGGAYVFCTNHIEPMRRSIIARCFYRSERVCAAISSSQIPALVGAIGGAILGATVANAFLTAVGGCVFILFCLFALIIAAIVAIVTTLVLAMIGGHIGKATTRDTSPRENDSGQSLAIGDFVTIKGPLLRADGDPVHFNGANVILFVKDTDKHGQSMSITARPFSYCELDEDFPLDGCAEELM